MENVLSLIAIVLSIVSFIYSYVVNRNSIIHDRKRDTLDAFNLLQEQVLDELNSYKKEDIAQICTNPRSAEYKKISALLARIEHFAVGVNEKIYDEETVRRLSGRHIVRTYENLECLIKTKRQFSQRIDSNKKELLFENFEKLAKNFGYNAKANNAQKTEEKETWLNL